VTPTTVGATRANRVEASSTKRWANRRSTGAVAAQARSTSNGTVSAATTAKMAAGPTTMPTTTTNTSRSTQVAANVRSRRVQASGEVRPRRVSPSGPHATTPAVTTPATGQSRVARAASTATPAPTAFSGDTVHHRSAKRLEEPAR